MLTISPLAAAIAFRFRSLDSVDVAGVVATPFGGPDWSHQPPKEDMLPHAIRWATGAHSNPSLWVAVRRFRGLVTTLTSVGPVAAVGPCCVCQFSTRFTSNKFLLRPNRPALAITHSPHIRSRVQMAACRRQQTTAMHTSAERRRPLKSWTVFWPSSTNWTRRGDINDGNLCSVARLPCLNLRALAPIAQLRASRMVRAGRHAARRCDPREQESKGTGAQKPPYSLLHAACFGRTRLLCGCDGLTASIFSCLINMQELLRAMAAESTERYASGQSLSEW